MVELDQFKYTLSTYEKPLQEVRESLNLDAKIRRIDELDKTMEEPSFWEDAELSTRLVKEAKHLKDTVAEFNRLQNQYEEIGLMIEMGYEENDPAIVPEIQKMVDEFVAYTETITMGDRTTVVRCVLRNGFEIVESSACVDPRNYSEELGQKICMEKIKDRIWELLGFLLQTAWHGIR